MPDYSLATHADYVVQLLDKLGIERAHLVGFSMGGGVAIELAHRHPERAASLTLLASIGVQEFELFGDYALNRSVHAVQLGALWALHRLLPQRRSTPPPCRERWDPLCWSGCCCSPPPP